MVQNNFSPSFEVLDVWLVSLAKHLTSGRALPPDLLSDIDNFKDLTTEKLNSPPASKKFDVHSAQTVSTPPLTSSSAPPSTNKSDLLNKLCAQCKPEAIIIESHSNGRVTPYGDMCDGNSDSTCVSNTTNNSNKCSKLYSNNCSSNSRNGNRYAGVILKEMNTSPPSLELDEADHVDGVAILKRPATSDVTQINSMIREIPKSPHLSKDFSPNGERLRNSIRARRQERMAKQRSMRTLTNFMTQQSTCSSDAGSETSGMNLDDAEEFSSFSPKVATFGRVHELKPTSHRRRSRPYGDKGFIINVNDGLLTINDVKDLNNCCSDDFDSSCDTSLNYIECNPISVAADTEITPLTNILIDMVSQSASLPLPDTDPMPKVNKITLDELRDEMHKCKSKLDALKLGTSSTSSWKQMAPLNGSNVSLHDMPKASPEIGLQSKLATHPAVNENKLSLSISPSSPYARLNPLSSPILNSRAANKLSKNSESQAADNSKKYSNKRHAVIGPPKHNNKCNNKNLTNNSTMLIERIGSSVAGVTAKFDPKANNAQKKTNEFFSHKLNNKINCDKNHSYVNRLYTAEGTSNELFGRKPPPSVSATNNNKKRDGIKQNQKPSEKLSATKKSQSIATSSTQRKIL